MGDIGNRLVEGGKTWFREKRNKENLNSVLDYVVLQVLVRDLVKGFARIHEPLFLEAAPCSYA